MTLVLSGAKTPAEISMIYRFFLQSIVWYFEFKQNHDETYEGNGEVIIWFGRVDTSVGNLYPKLKGGRATSVHVIEVVIE